MIHNNILEKIGNTPLVKIHASGLGYLNLYAKLEYYNPMGSVKDRAAYHILNKLLKSGEINKDTIIIESSSGNFGIALAAYCKYFGLKFYCVVDKNISTTNKYLIEQLSTKMITVDEEDENGAYLLNRIKEVEKIQQVNKNAYWINQYANLYNSEAYAETLGREICKDMTGKNIDYIFLGVSSGGTITGVSQQIKKIFPDTKVIAVDIDGSIIFGGKSKKRYIPGIGSSMVPDLLKNAKIDDTVVISESETTDMCRELLISNNLFVGGSAGSVYAAIKKYFKEINENSNQNVVAIFADRGDRYINTVYNNEWCNNFLGKKYEVSK